MFAGIPASTVIVTVLLDCTVPSGKVSCRSDLYDPAAIPAVKFDENTMFTVPVEPVIVTVLGSKGEVAVAGAVATRALAASRICILAVQPVRLIGALLLLHTKENLHVSPFFTVGSLVAILEMPLIWYF
jgi:hypothetical protein